MGHGGFERGLAACVCVNLRKLNFHFYACTHTHTQKEREDTNTHTPTCTSLDESDTSLQQGCQMCAQLKMKPPG